MPNPLVTIVTPSYNQGSFIRSTIESVLSQNYQPIEYIVMDGGSTDETAAIVKEYGSRLTFISERDRGQSHAINKGFRMARGSIVSWLNSDDWILPGAVAHAVSALAQHPEAGAVYGEGYMLDRAGGITGRFRCTEPFNLWKLVYLSDYVLQQTVYFRRSAIESAGYLREDLHYAMDWDLLIRIAKQQSLHYIPEYMGCLREYPEAKSFSGGAARVREIASILREHTGLHYPPGYIVYGLETYRKIWCDTIGEHSPLWLGPVSRRLQSVLSILCGYCIEATIRTAQGWYSDQWAGPRLRYMLPVGSEGNLVLSGKIPNWGPQKLTVTARGVQIARRIFQPGEFEWSIPISAGAAGEPIPLLIKSSRWLTPGVRELAAGWRRLSYILRSIRLEPARGERPDPGCELASAAGPGM